MKDPHCAIGTVVIKKEHKPAGSGFRRAFIHPEKGYYCHRWELTGVSSDGALFRYERKERAAE